MEEARTFSQALELGVPGAIALAWLRPDVEPHQILDISKRWTLHKSVRACRFDWQQWLASSNVERWTAAAHRSFNAMAWFLMQENLGELTDAKLRKALTFLKLIEEKLGTQAAAPDLAKQFWDEFQQTRKKQPGHESTVGLGGLMGPEPGVQ